MMGTPDVFHSGSARSTSGWLMVAPLLTSPGTGTPPVSEDAPVAEEVGVLQRAEHAVGLAGRFAASNGEQREAAFTPRLR